MSEESSYSAPDRARPSDLPDGVLDSAELFFLAIREKASAGLDRQMIDDAIKFLQEDFIASMRKIDANWEGNGRRYGMAFWTGAYLGAKVSWHRYLMNLRAKTLDAERELAEKPPTV